MSLDTNLTNQFGVKFWIISASIVIVVAGLKAAGAIVTPFCLALVISAICLGPFIWLKERGLPEWFSIIIIIAAMIIVSALVVMLLGASVSKFADKAPFYGEKLTQYWGNINEWLVNKGLFEEDSGLTNVIKPKSILDLVGDVFSDFGGLMSNSLMILLVVVFLLMEITVIDKKIKIIKPESITGIRAVIDNIKKYFVTKTLTSLFTGICVFVGLAMVGVDFPILWGFLAFLLNYIPNIGSALAAVPAVLVALVQLGPGSALLTVVIYLLVNGIIGNIIEPKIMGKNLGLSTLVVFLSLIFWGWVLGTVGMLLATPLTITIKLILDEMDETKWMGLLLGDESSLDHLKNSRK
jgi:predicted PurR-regulated permease PerM